MNQNIYVSAVKVAKGKIELEYVDLDDNRPYSTEEKDTPHPDLYNALKKLVPFLATVYYVSKNEEKISINGFSSGKDSDYVVIKGMLTVASGKKQAINSDPIDVEKEVYGFEQDLASAIKDIQNEADQFFFGNKRAATQEELDFKEGEDQQGATDPGEPVSQEEKNKDIGDEMPKDGKTAAAEPPEPENTKEGDGVPGL